MSGESSIEWTDATWNPIRGCSRVSPGCENCYAERTAARFGGKGLAYEGLATIGKNGPRWTGAVQLVMEHLDDPIRWRRGRRIFVNSMSDLFHERLTDETIALVFAVMAMAPHHTFQVLTKRPERMEAWFASGRDLTVAGIKALATMGKLGARWKQDAFPELPAWPLPNVWLGTTVEDQKRADERIPHLLSTPAAVRFLSCDPLLEHVDLFAFLKTDLRDRSLVALGAAPGVDWCIVGGESGPGARGFSVEWARSIVKQCRAAGVPVFVKQMGARPMAMSFLGKSGVDVVRLESRKGNNPAEWPEDLRLREMPEVRS
jgi:protein gp37